MLNEDGGGADRALHDGPAGPAVPEPVYRLDSSRWRRAHYARGALPLVIGLGIALYSLWILLYVQWNPGAVVFVGVGAVLAVQGLLVMGGAAVNPDFAIHNKYLILPGATPVQALRHKGRRVPFSQIEAIEPGTDDRYTFRTTRGEFGLDLRDHSTDPEDIADMRLHINRLIDALDEDCNGGRGHFSGTVLRKRTARGSRKRKGRNREPERRRRERRQKDAQAQ